VHPSGFFALRLLDVGVILIITVIRVALAILLMA
jgi:hypothetical protein